MSWTPFLAVASFKAHSAPSSSQSGKGCKQWRVNNSGAHDSLSACAGRSPRGGGSVARQYRHRRDRRLASAPARGQRSFAPAGAHAVRKPILRNQSALSRRREASMAKALVTLCCLLAMGTPAFASGEAALSESDAKAFTAVYGAAEEESAQDFVETVQLGERLWTCFARGRSGRFSGQSRSANVARRVALERCRNRSSRCVITSCR